MPQKQQTHAVINWTDSSVLQILSLADGKESIIAFPTRESLQGFTSNNGFVGVNQILQIDDGQIAKCNFDGTLTPIPFLNQFGIQRFFKVFEMPSVNLIAASFYDDAIGDSKTVFFSSVDGTVVRTLVGYEVTDASGHTFGPPALFSGDCLNIWQGRIVYMHHNGAFESKLCAYDPVTNTTNYHTLTDQGARIDDHSFIPHFHNNKLYMVPASTNDTVNAATVFEIDAAWTITPHLIANFDGDSASRIAQGLRGDSLNKIGYTGNTGRHIPYRAQYNNNRADNDAIVIDLDTMTATFNQLAVPGGWPFDIVADGISGMNAEFSAVGSTMFAIIGSAKNAVTQARHRVNKLFVWNGLTGALLNTFPVTVADDSYGDIYNLYGMTLPLFEVTGNVTLDDVGTVAKVKLLDVDSGLVVAETQSNGAGAYGFNCFTASPKVSLAKHPTEAVYKQSGVMVPTAVME